MTKTFSRVLVAVALFAVPGAALAQDDEGSYADDAYTYEEDPSYAEEAPVAAQPNAPEPALLPPPPPTAAAAVQVQAAPAGQWTYTNQYGWVFLPYDQTYTYVPADGGTPSVYAYYPSYGWRWIVAPWVYGVGPRPYWGVHGVSRYVWHSRPWFRVPSHVHYRHHYRATPVHVGGHRSHVWAGGHRGHGDHRGGARHEYRGHGGGNRHWSGGDRGRGGHGGHRGGGNRGTHAARPAGRR